MAEKLGDWQKTAWASLLFAHANLFRQIEERVGAAGGPGLDVYSVLLALEEAPNQRMKMSELADQLFLTRSGATRLVDRLAKCGYVRRATCPHDRRVVYTEITKEGGQKRAFGWPAYEAAIAETFGSKLSSEEAKLLSRMLARFAPEGHPMLNVGLKHAIGS